MQKETYLVTAHAGIAGEVMGVSQVIPRFKLTLNFTTVSDRNIEILIL